MPDAKVEWSREPPVEKFVLKTKSRHGRSGERYLTPGYLPDK